MQTFGTWLRQGTYQGDEACCAHLESIRELQPNRQQEHDYLYECLSVLDTKTQGLLAFDSILLVIATLGLSGLSRDSTGPRIFIIASLVLAGIAALVCLPVISLAWTDTKDLAREDALFIALLKVRNRRTILYRCSWAMAMCSVILVLLGLVLHYL